MVVCALAPLLLLCVCVRVKPAIRRWYRYSVWHMGRCLAFFIYFAAPGWLSRLLLLLNGRRCILFFLFLFLFFDRFYSYTSRTRMFFVGLVSFHSCPVPPRLSAQCRARFNCFVCAGRRGSASSEHPKLSSGSRSIFVSFFVRFRSLSDGLVCSQARTSWRGRARESNLGLPTDKYQICC